MLFILCENTRFTGIYIIPYSNKYRQVYYWYTTILFIYFFIPLGDYVSKSHFFMIYGAFVLHHSFLYRCCHNLIVSPCAKQTWATVIHLFWACENLNGSLVNAQSWIHHTTCDHIVHFLFPRLSHCANVQSCSPVVPMTAVTMPKIAKIFVVSCPSLSGWDASPTIHIRCNCIG